MEMMHILKFGSFYSGSFNLVKVFCFMVMKLAFTVEDYFESDIWKCSAFGFVCTSLISFLDVVHVLNMSLSLIIFKIESHYMLSDTTCSRVPHLSTTEIWCGSDQQCALYSSMKGERRLTNIKVTKLCERP